MDFAQRVPRQTSADLFAEAQHYFPGGVNSPVRAFRSVSGPPLFIAEGHGSHMTDVDGNRFLDFAAPGGPSSTATTTPTSAIRSSTPCTAAPASAPPTDSATSSVALILSNHRYVERLRFVSSGTEAVMSALRLARGVTGRSKIIKFDGCITTAT